MSMPQDIVDKFQQYLDDLSDAIIDVVRAVVPDLPPEEQQNTPILMSDSAFATCLIEVNRGMAINEYSIYGGEGCIFKCDISLSNNNLTFSLGDFVGITSTWVDYWNDRNVILENANHWKWNIAHEGEITARIWDLGFDFRLYYEGAYHDTDISLDWNIPLELSDCKQYSASAPAIRTGNSGVVSYTVDSDDVITCTPDRDLQPGGSNTLIFAIKGYPLIMNASDMSYINDFVTNNDATNNYNTTYTTPDNKTITVYYGDNYVITHVNNNDPVSYNDVKNALNIAVNQINDDNDVDLNVPDYPIPPDPDDDDTDGQDFGAGSSLGGSDMLWLLTAQQMSDFHAALNGGITTGFNPFDSIISVMGLAIPPTYILDEIEIVTNIIIPKSDGTSWSSGVNGHICTSQKSAFGFVNLSLDRKYNNFLDFSPYSTHEIFIPMCGWLPLPDIAVNRTLCVYYVPDIQNCSVRGLVGIYGDGGKVDIIGEKYGAIGAEVPITNNGHALFVSGAISGGVQTLANGLNGIFGAAGTKNPWFGGSGLMSAIATGTQSMMNTQRNISSVIGQNQDRSAFSDGTHIMIKSSYPQIKLDPLYGHTHGFVCYRSGQLSEFSGFTICENPHISGITCTSDEKEEIKRLLESGVILPDGE